MKLKSFFIAVLMCIILGSCNNISEQKTAEKKADSLRMADSIAQVREKQRIIDSVNMVSKEQQIIADSIQSQFNN